MWIGYAGNVARRCGSHRCHFSYDVSYFHCVSPYAVFMWCLELFVNFGHSDAQLFHCFAAFVKPCVWHFEIFWAVYVTHFECVAQLCWINAVMIICSGFGNFFDFHLFA